MKKLNANKKTTNKAEKVAKKQAGNKLIEPSQITNAIPVKTTKEKFGEESIYVQSQISNINKKVQFTDTNVDNYSIDNDVGYTVSNNVQNKTMKQEESDMNAKNVESSVQVGIAVKNIDIGDSRYNNSDKNRVQLGINVENNSDTGGSRYNNSDKNSGNNEMIKTFRKNKKTMPIHRETPLMLRRSSLLNDIVGTLPFETESSSNDEKAIANIEIQNEAIIPDKTIDVPRKYGKKVSAAKKNFQNLLISATTKEQDIDKDSLPPMEKKKNRKKRTKKKQNVYDDNSNGNSTLSSPSTGGYRKHFSNALLKLASFSRRKNNK